ncbi:MAG: LamG domain-containing protein [Prevotellaceae bacterium]|jgi:hypothetical protein|nr:LamG domain-containing protein [Prevotellaceae bacterium]
MKKLLLIIGICLPMMIYAQNNTAKINLDEGLIVRYLFDGNANAEGSVKSLNSTTKADIIQYGEDRLKNAKSTLNALVPIELPINISPKKYPVLTIAFWMKQSAKSKTAYIFSSGTPQIKSSDLYTSTFRSFALCGNTPSVFYTAPNGYPETMEFSSLSSMKWIPVVIIYNQRDSVIKACVDGELKTVKGTNKESLPTVLLGSLKDKKDVFRGYIDDFSIYNRELNNAEIEAFTGKKITDADESDRIKMEYALLFKAILPIWMITLSIIMLLAMLVQRIMMIPITVGKNGGNSNNNKEARNLVVDAWKSLTYVSEKESWKISSYKQARTAMGKLRKVASLKPTEQQTHDDVESISKFVHSVAKRSFGGSKTLIICALLLFVAFSLFSEFGGDMPFWNKIAEFKIFWLSILFYTLSCFAPMYLLDRRMFMLSNPYKLEGFYGGLLGVILSTNLSHHPDYESSDRGIETSGWFIKLIIAIILLFILVATMPLWGTVNFFRNFVIYR